MPRVARSSLTYFIGAALLGCGSAPAPVLATTPVAAHSNHPALPAPRVAPSPALVVTAAPPALPRLETAPGPAHVSETPLTAARTEADFGCEHATDERLSPPLQLLEVTETVRLWASTGPAFPASLLTRRALLSVSTTGDAPVRLACGAEVSVDLEPGRYWVRGQTRTNLEGDSGDSRALTGFAYRLSEPGDVSCPLELATRGIHDWDGEFPFEVSADEHIDDDATPDVRVDYQLAFTNAATRLLVAEPYPTCFRVVADGGVAREMPGRAHGYRNFRWAFRPLHPVEGWGGRVVTEYEAPYSATTGSYETGRFLACREALLGDSPSRDRERLCDRWLRATDPMTWPDALVTRWLDSAPSERERVPRALTLNSEATTTLLSALDQQGFRAEVVGSTPCAPSPQRQDFAFRIALLPPEGTTRRDAFVLVTRRPGARDQISGVFMDASPCAAADTPDGASTFLDRWLEQPWSVARASSSGARGIQAAHARWQSASRAELFHDRSARSCATSLLAPAAATWLYTAWIAGANPEDGEPPPSYLVVGQRGASFVVLAASDVRPAHCG